LAEEPNDATPFLPERRSLKALRESAAGCRGCHLWRPATQTVFGEGRKASRVMLVGEQPGDREDRAGEPVVSSTAASRRPASSARTPT
jgi:uracil-DNA glycosylase